jgi:hypothetical protein
MPGEVTLEDLIHDEEGLAVVRDSIAHLREHWSEPDATDAEALVAICRGWLFEAQCSFECHEG